MDAIVESIVPLCGCDFREDRITDRVFQCFSSSPQSVTYHAQLHGTLNANVSELIGDIEDWVSTGVTIPVQLLPLKVSSVCVVSSSIPVDHCPGEATTGPPTTESSTLVIAVSVSIGAMVAFAIAITVTLAVCLHHHRQSKVKKQR